MSLSCSCCYHSQFVLSLLSLLKFDIDDDVSCSFYHKHDITTPVICFVLYIISLLIFLFYSYNYIISIYNRGQKLLSLIKIQDNLWLETNKVLRLQKKIIIKYLFYSWLEIDIYCSINKRQQLFLQKDIFLNIKRRNFGFEKKI